jgi:hypothetical protein
VDASDWASDEVLWERSVAGDGEAFGGLFDRHRDRLFHHACHLSGTWSTAEDVGAATFLELWRRHADVRLARVSECRTGEAGHVDAQCGAAGIRRGRPR